MAEKLSEDTDKIRARTPENIRLHIIGIAKNFGISIEESQFRCFLEACARFYGNFSLKNAYDLYTKRYKIQLSEADFRKFVKNVEEGDDAEAAIPIAKIASMSKLYDSGSKDFWDKEIIYPRLFEEKDEGKVLYYVIADKKRQDNTPIKYLPWTDFIDIYATDHIESDESACDLAFFFFKKLDFTTDQKISNFLGRVTESAHLGKNPHNFIDNDRFFREFTKRFKYDFDTLDDGMDLVGNVYNNTPTMYNNGYTPLEYYQIAFPDEFPSNKMPVNFSEEMREDIRSGKISVRDFAEILEEYPEHMRVAAMEEFQRIRNPMR